MKRSKGLLRAYNGNAVYSFDESAKISHLFARAALTCRLKSMPADASAANDAGTFFVQAKLLTGIVNGKRKRNFITGETIKTHFGELSNGG